MIKQPSWELRTLDTLRRSSLMAIVEANVTYFTKAHGSRPELIVLHSSLRSTLAVELIKAAGMQPTDAVAEPMWIDGVPLIYSATLNGFIFMFNKKLQKEELL